MTLVKNQLDIIYNGLDLEFRRDVKRPEDATTINSFLTSLDDCKHEWWAYASRHGGRNAGFGRARGLPHDDPEWDQASGEAEAWQGGGHAYRVSV